MTHIERLNFLVNEDRDFFLEIKNDTFYNNGGYINDNHLNRKETEKNRQECIIESYQELLSIILESENNDNNECANIIYKYYPKLSKAAHSVFRPFHCGQLYCPKNSHEYSRLKKEVERYLTPLQENRQLINGYHGARYDEYTY